MINIAENQLSHKIKVIKKVIYFLKSLERLSSYYKRYLTNIKNKSNYFKKKE